MTAKACVSGSTLAKAASHAGRPEIGNSEPAKNHGTMAMAGTAPMYSSCLAMRLARVSAAPYITTAIRAAAAANRAMPEGRGDHDAEEDRRQEGDHDLARGTGG